MSKVIGIVGSRRRNSPKDALIVAKKFFEVYKEGDTICSGGCPKGADSFAEGIGYLYLIPISVHYPNWNSYGGGAGFIRNTDIAKTSDILIACVSKDRKGGTEDTIRKFKGFRPEGKVILC